jgi:hypothetical protein
VPFTCSWKNEIPAAPRTLRGLDNASGIFYAPAESDSWTPKALTRAALFWPGIEITSSTVLEVATDFTNGCRSSQAEDGSFVVIPAFERCSVQAAVGALR